MLDLHTFFRDMRLPRAEVETLVRFYLESVARPCFSTAEEIMDELVNFRRSVLTRKVYQLFGD